METKKVIEQKDRGDIEIRYDIDYHEIELEQDYPIGRNDLIYIEKSKATEVAKAIDPKYQEVEDRLNELEQSNKDFITDAHVEILKLKDQNTKLLKGCKIGLSLYEAVLEDGQVSVDNIPKAAKIIEFFKEAIQQSETKSKDNE